MRKQSSPRRRGLLALIVVFAAQALVGCSDNENLVNRCPELAQKCTDCVDPGVRASCEEAVAKNDSSICEVTLESASIQQCGGAMPLPTHSFLCPT
jgi:hypothetical protein